MARTGLIVVAAGTTTPGTAGLLIATTTTPATETTTWASAFAVQGIGPMRCVYGCTASAKALTIVPDLLRLSSDKHDPPGGC